MIKDLLYKWRNLIRNPLGPPTERERKLIDELRLSFKMLPEAIWRTPDADEEWIRYQKRIQYLVLNEDPRAFLRWDVICQTMFVPNSAYIREELEFLKREEHWKNRWQTAIEESSIGCPTPYSLYPRSSATLIHHAYHLCQFEKAIGSLVDKLDLVWEFGGGYGSLCRLFYQLGFTGTFIIFDFQPVLALQRFFLDSLNIPLVSIEDCILGKRGVLLISDINDLEHFLKDPQISNIGKKAFVATWSISETPLEFRQAILNVAADFDYFLIAYHDEFGGINNVEFMDAWKSTLERRWHSSAIEHLPGNKYLLERERERQTRDDTPAHLYQSHSILSGTAVLFSRLLIGSILNNMASLGSLINRALLSIIPSQNKRIFGLCKQYADRYNGENNDQMETNGELHFMQQSLPQCHTVFDVGANVGHWATLALAINSQVNIHCFEPSPVTYQQLTSNCFPQNVTCNNFGLSSVPSEADLFVFEAGAGINSLYKRRGLQSFGLKTQTLKERIKLDTIDCYCDNRSIKGIDFLKIDVEGHELEVFKGSLRMLQSERVNIIQFEYGGCNIDARVLLKDIFDLFAPLNYSFFKILPKELRPVPIYDQRFENFQYQNWAVVRNGYDLLLP